jgi:hypothetical protein
MTEEDFLKRWSRRKREVAKAEAELPAEGKPAEPQPQLDATRATEPEFDPASLPPIESISALTDVTAFLRAGVPAELTRAALRRVWTADPAIRNFVGLAENAWDFTDPNAMPGFGPLESTEEVRQMIANLVDKIGEAAQGHSPERDGAAQTLGDSNVLGGSDADDRGTRIAAAPDQDAERSAEVSQGQVLLQSNKEDVAMQRDATEGVETTKQSSPRIHGSALPR